MPVSAVVARADVMSWSAGAHGSTYGGNPVALAAMIETIRLLEEGLVANAAIRGEEALAGLRDLVDRYPGMVREVRGKGLMVGVELVSGEVAEAVQLAAFRRGLLVLEAGDDVVRMCPPLMVSEAEVATAVRIFESAVEEVAGHRAEAIEAVHAAAREGLLDEEVESAI